MTETKVTSLSDHRQQRAESRFEAAIRKFMAIGRTQEEATVLLGSNHRKPLRPFSRAAAINADESEAIAGAAAAVSATRLDLRSAFAIVGIPWPGLGPGRKFALPLGSPARAKGKESEAAYLGGIP
jgi:hypothetical protein